MKNFLLAFTILFLSTTEAQKYRVYFKDKGESVEMLSNPLLFLSQRSLERRADDGIWVNETDLPVSKKYLSDLKGAGAHVLATSRWFNYALIENRIQNFPSSVSRIEKVEKYKLTYTSIADAGLSLEYGNAATQIQMLRGDILHNLNYQGEGVAIAVIDGGFLGADTISSLDSLRTQGRLLASYDFVDGDTNIYNRGHHGTMVLSTMAAYIPFDIIGTAPKASYILLTSEDDSRENPVEMDNWLLAAEFADSAGADVINSSLGYSTFDDAQDDFTYQDMDGNTTIVTKAAEMASRKGIAVTVSAGNEGTSSWEYITAPADADSIIAVGAVDSQKNYVGFRKKDN